MKSFVIRLKDIEVSETLADDCVRSGLDLGLEIEKFDGIFGEKNIERMHKFFNIRPIHPKMKKNRIGVKGCFLSHYSLWKQAAELEESLLIFEHDAVLLNEINDDILDQFEDVLMLDPFNKFSKSYDTSHYESQNVEQRIVEYINPEPKLKYGLQHEYPMGLQAYIIKPEAAIKLISHVELYGYLPADMQCNKGSVKLNTVSKPLASVNKKFYQDKLLMSQMSTTQKNGYVDGIS
jgi:GR25 family glycosyltransferase involved in LPS biosynthesis